MLFNFRLENLKKKNEESGTFSFVCNSVLWVFQSAQKLPTFFIFIFYIPPGISLYKNGSSTQTHIHPHKGDVVNHYIVVRSRRRIDLGACGRLPKPEGVAGSVNDWKETHQPHLASDPPAPFPPYSPTPSIFFPSNITFRGPPILPQYIYDNFLSA